MPLHRTNEAKKTSLPDLPDMAIDPTLKKLNPIDRARLRGVCRGLRDSIDQSAFVASLYLAHPLQARTLGLPPPDILSVGSGVTLGRDDNRDKTINLRAEANKSWSILANSSLQINGTDRDTHYRNVTRAVYLLDSEARERSLGSTSLPLIRARTDLVYGPFWPVCWTPEDRGFVDNIREENDKKIHLWSDLSPDFHYTQQLFEGAIKNLEFRLDRAVLNLMCAGIVPSESSDMGFGIVPEEIRRSSDSLFRLFAWKHSDGRNWQLKREIESIAYRSMFQICWTTLAINIAAPAVEIRLQYLDVRNVGDLSQDESRLHPRGLPQDLYGAFEALRNDVQTRLPRDMVGFLSSGP